MVPRTLGNAAQLLVCMFLAWFVDTSARHFALLVTTFPSKRKLQFPHLFPPTKSQLLPLTFDSSSQIPRIQLLINFKMDFSKIGKSFTYVPNRELSPPLLFPLLLLEVASQGLVVSNCLFFRAMQRLWCANHALCVAHLSVYQGAVRSGR